MVLHPCAGALALSPSRGITSDGYLLRLHKRYPLHAATANSCGYLYWFPSYHNPGLGAGATSGNFYVFETVSPSTSPTNSDGAGVYGGEGTGGMMMADPAAAFVQSDIVNSAKTVAACLRFTYSGAAQYTSGLVAPLVGLDPHNVSKVERGLLFPPPMIYLH